MRGRESWRGGGEWEGGSWRGGEWEGGRELEGW